MGIDDLMWWKIKKFGDDLEMLESFLIGFAARDYGLRSLGYRFDQFVLRYHQSDEVLSAFEDFSFNIDTCLRLAPLTDKSTSDRLNTLLSETNLEDLVTQLSVRLVIARQRRPLHRALGFAGAILSISRLFSTSQPRYLFTDNTIALESVLASLSRLKMLVRLLEKENYRKTASDDEIFKPSNVDINFVVVQVDAAISDINTSNDIEASEKERLIKYLSEAKIELAQDYPAWKKIVGAFVICATLLSGIADAPKALDNINDATKHILGTSVEKKLPYLLPEPPALNKGTNDDGPAIVKT